MKKVYICYVERYDYFDSLCDHTYHKSDYETLGSNPIEALQAYRNLKNKDYNYGDSYQKTHNIQIMWVVDNITNNHNFFTPQCERLRKFPVVGWDNSVVDYIVTSEKELESMDCRQQLNQIGFYYSSIDKTIRSLELSINKDTEIGPYVSDEFDIFDIDNSLPF